VSLVSVNAGSSPARGLGRGGGTRVMLSADDYTAELAELYG